MNSVWHVWDDMCTKLTCNLHSLFYSDDTVIFSDTETDFQHALDSCKTYCDTWKLNINVTNTKIIICWRNDRRVMTGNCWMNRTVVSVSKQCSLIQTIHTCVNDSVVLNVQEKRFRTDKQLLNPC